MAALSQSLAKGGERQRERVFKGNGVLNFKVDRRNAKMSYKSDGRLRDLAAGTSSRNLA